MSRVFVTPNKLSTNGFTLLDYIDMGVGVDHGHWNLVSTLGADCSGIEFTVTPNLVLGIKCAPDEVATITIQPNPQLAVIDGMSLAPKVISIKGWSNLIDQQQHYLFGNFCSTIYADNRDRICIDISDPTKVFYFLVSF